MTACLGLCLAGAWVAPGCAAEPKVKCTASSGPAAVRYRMVSMVGDCSMIANAAGETLGLQTYVPPGVTDPDSYNTPNAIAIQSENVGLLLANGESVMPPVVDADMTHKPYAFGRFDSAFPGDDNLCTVSSMTAAELTLAAVPEHMMEGPDGMMETVPEQPATHIKYEWSHVRIVVSAESIGTQTFADLTYTQDGCTAKFAVALLTPQVSCARDDGTLDPLLCQSSPDPARGFTGSGIGDGIPVTCDPDQKVCLPDKSAP
jgi:hypothetical protein